MILTDDEKYEINLRRISKNAELREQWLTFKRPVSTVLPFHGTGYIDRQADDLASIMRPLVRPELTHWDEIGD